MCFGWLHDYLKGWPLRERLLHFKIFQKTLILAFKANSVLSRQMTLFCRFFFVTEQFRRGQQREKKFQTTLILVFEVIVQPPKTHFLTFSSETKIMKITHSDPAIASSLLRVKYCSIVLQAAITRHLNILL